MMRHLRQILNVKWYDFVSNREILSQANLPSMYDLLIRKNLRWAGHVNRMESSQLPKQILFPQLEDEVRGIGRPKLRFCDSVKRNLKDRLIPTGSWQTLSRDRDKWRMMVHRKSSSDTKDSTWWWWYICIYCFLNIYVYINIYPFFLVHNSLLLFISVSSGQPRKPPLKTFYRNLDATFSDFLFDNSLGESYLQYSSSYTCVWNS